MNDQPVSIRSVAIDLIDGIKTKINNIQTVQLEPGATVAKKYPAEISGNTVNILPIQSGDSNYVVVNSITPPSGETGRSIGIDLNDTVKNKTQQYPNCSAGARSNTSQKVSSRNIRKYCYYPTFTN